MPTYEITAPDGRVLEITVPDGATQESVLAYVQQHYTPGQRQYTAEERMQRSYAGSDQRGNPTDGMSRTDRFLAGMGRSVAETGRGLRQVGSAVADAIPGVDLSNYRQGLQEEIDEARRLDAPLLDTGWGQVGNIVGGMAQLVAPGAALRGTTAARGLLPTTIRGNALQGGALGALQPTATGESRTENALIGGGAGAAGTAAVNAAGAGLRGARNLLTGIGVSGVDRAAGGRLREEAADAANLLIRAPSAVPGVQRTLAEETRDEGIARLEQTLRGQGAGYNWGALDTRNNTARTQALEAIAGTDADMAAAEAARGAQASVARDAAMQAGPVDVSGTLMQLDEAIAGAQGRPAVQAGLRQVRALLAQEYEGVPGMVTTMAEDRVPVLDNVRMTIGDMLGGRYGGDNAAALAGSRELVGIRDSLNDEIGRQVPAFTDYLNAYRQGSVPINRMEVGRELLRRGTQNVQTDNAGNRTLAARPLANAARDTDSIAAKATGFSKAKATDILTSVDIAIIKAMQDDMERQAFARSAGTGGNSASAARAGVMSRLGSSAGNAVAGILPYGANLGRAFAQFLDSTGNQRINERLAYLVADPSEARRVLEALPPAGQQIVGRALAALSGAVATGVGVTEATRDQPVYDLEGGTTGAAPTAEEMERLRAQARAIRASMGSAAAAIPDLGSQDGAAPVQRATNPRTGEVIELRNGQWVPAR